MSLYSSRYRSRLDVAQPFCLTRNNITMLNELLVGEANQNSDPVNLQSWQGRLSRLRDEPWASVKDWTTVIGPKRKESVLQPR